jgi:hypothetical protein
MGGEWLPFCAGYLYPQTPHAHVRGMTGVSQSGTRMPRRSSASFRLWLVAALFGLSALLPTGAAHARESARPADVSSAHAAQDAAATPDTGVSGADLFAPAHLRGVSHPRLVHALPRTSTPATLFRASCVIAPSFARRLPARESVMALSSAPRSPGPSRAPPVA